MGINDHDSLLYSMQMVYTTQAYTASGDLQLITSQYPVSIQHTKEPVEKTKEMITHTAQMAHENETRQWDRKENLRATFASPARMWADVPQWAKPCSVLAPDNECYNNVEINSANSSNSTKKLARQIYSPQF
jgi:hypothetical protein